MIDFLELALPVAEKIAFAVAVLAVGLLLIKWITKRVSKLVDKKGIDETLKPFIKSLVSVLLKIFLIVAIISILGIETTSFVAVLASAGLAIGLAFQGSLSNFAGGILLLYTRPFRVGNYIEANGRSGTVEAIRILYTEIVTIDNKVVHIPNGSLSNATIVNYSEKDTRRVDLNFSAGYTADTAKVIGVISKILSEHSKVLKTPEPFVRMSEHGESAVIYTVRAWVNSKDYWDVYFDLIETVKRRFDEEGISIPYPQMDVHFNSKS